MPLTWKLGLTGDACVLDQEETLRTAETLLECTEDGLFCDRLRFFVEQKLAFTNLSCGDGRGLKIEYPPSMARVGGIFAQLYLNVPQVASDQDGSNVGSVLGDTEGGDSEGGSTLNGDRLTGKINIFPLELPSS